MTIHPTPELEARLSDIARRTGRDVDSVAQEALARYVEAEERRAELIATLDEAEQAIERGECTEYTAEGLAELMEDVKRRGRERLAAQGQQPR